MKKLLIYDIQSSFYINRWKWLGVIFIFGLLPIVYTYLDNGITSSDLTYALFRGAELPDPTLNFKIPYFFVLLQLYSIFLIGHFVYDDYHSFGMYVFTRAQTKYIWFSSKILWFILNTTFYYLVCFFLIAIPTGFTFKWGRILDLSTSSVGSTASIFFLMYSSALAVGMIHLTLSFLTSPIYSYILIAIFYMMPVFTNTCYLPGDQAMLTRHFPFTNVPIYLSYIYNGLLFLFFLFLFWKIIKEKDIVSEPTLGGI